MTAFVGFPKIARFSRECIVTEKIDGTNAQVWIPSDAEREQLEGVQRSLPFIVASRSQYLTPPGDNHGFSKWAYEHTDELLQLGPGRHFGEWWGSGINRGYGLAQGEKRFSLFNLKRWRDERPACCGVVPVLWEGAFNLCPVLDILAKLTVEGSVASPGFMKPEGIVIYHVQGNVMFKKTIEKDERPKGAPEHA